MVDARQNGWSCIPDPLKANRTVEIQIFIDKTFAASLAANKSRPDLQHKTPCVGPNHGFVAKMSQKAMQGKRTLSVFAVNQGGTPHLVQLGADERLCDGVSCSAAAARRRDADAIDGGGREQLLDDISVWSAAQMMRAIL